MSHTLKLFQLTRRAFASLRLPQSPIIPFHTRHYTITHMTRTQQDRSLRDRIAVCDYKVLHNELNHFSKDTLNPIVANLVTLHDFRRNIKDGHELNTKRRLKGTRKARLQGSFCLFLHSLHYSCLSRDKHTGTTKYFNTKLYHQIGNVLSLRKESQLEALVTDVRNIDPEFDDKVQQCLSLYMYGDSTIPRTDGALDSHNWRNLTTSFAALMSQFADETHLHDVLGWISCVVANNVADACSALSGQRSIPSFITKDILGRVPKSDYEVELLHDLYKKESNANSSMWLLISLIHHTKMYRYQDLEGFISVMLTRETGLSIEDLNKLVFVIGEPVNKVMSKEFSFTIIRAQRLIVEDINTRGDDLLTASGYLGMAMSLSEVSMSRAQIFHEKAFEYSPFNEEVELMENRVRLKLSMTEFQLNDAFDSISTGPNTTNTALWTDFFRFSQEFGTITEKKSTMFIQHSMNYSTLSNGRSPLLRTLDPSLIFQLTTNLDNKSISALMSRLYQHPTPIMNFPSGPHAARHLFQSISHPSRSIIGEVLYGEAILEPEGAYERFSKFVYRYCDGIANEKCLLSLIVPGLKHEGLKWENRKAPQLAVHEFRKVVKFGVGDDNKPHVAGERLWRQYIKLCGRCDYQYELGEVFEAWESLRFVPDKNTLGLLLGAVSDGVGERIRDHGVKYLSPDTYDEITNDVWDWPTKRTIAFWRHRIQSEMLDG